MGPRLWSTLWTGCGKIWSCDSGAVEDRAKKVFCRLFIRNFHRRTSCGRRCPHGSRGFRHLLKSLGEIARICGGRWSGTLLARGSTRFCGVGGPRGLMRSVRGVSRWGRCSWARGGNLALLTGLSTDSGAKLWRSSPRACAYYPLGVSFSDRRPHDWTRNCGAHA